MRSSAQTLAREHTAARGHLAAVIDRQTTILAVRRGRELTLWRIADNSVVSITAPVARLLYARRTSNENRAIALPAGQTVAQLLAELSDALGHQLTVQIL